MQTLRREFLRLAACAAAFPTTARFAFAQSYPSRPVHLLVGYAPGGGNDIAARLMGQWLSQRLSQQFVVENRPGAGTNIANEAVANAAPDGYMLLLVGLPAVTGASLFPNLKFTFIRDITAVGGIAREPLVMVVNPSFPAKTLADFIKYARANPGKVNLASPGVGSAAHLAGELFQSKVGVTMVHVPYRGTGPALTALLGAQADVLFPPPLAALAHIKSGRLRGLGVTTAARLDTLPELPSIGEVVPGYEMSIWYGIGAPKGTPADVIDKLNREINAGLADQKIKARLVDSGGIVMRGSPSDFGKFMVQESEKWAGVIRAANIKSE